MTLKLFILIFLIYTPLLAKEIKIAVATNVSYAIEDLKKEFSKIHPQIKVQVILGSSGKLTAQIMNGASYDLFISADLKYPNALFEKKLTTSKPIIYAQGKLAIISTKELNCTDNINILKDKKIRKIAIANQKTAPYGKATLQALQNAKIYNDIKRKLVYAESISQTLSYTLTATDAGLVAKSLLFSPKMSKFKEGKNWCDINSSLYTPINQGIVLLKNNNAKDFYDFLLSENAKEIFKKYGYLVP